MAVGAWATLALFALALPAHAKCTAATEFQPRLCTTGLPRATSVVVSKHTSTEAAQACEGFRLNAAQVRRYFSKARRVDSASEHDLDRSACAASGTVKFADGRRADWRIEQIGTATLVFRGSGKTLQLMCPDCRFVPFAN